MRAISRKWRWLSLAVLASALNLTVCAGPDGIFISTGDLFHGHHDHDDDDDWDDWDDDHYCCDDFGDDFEDWWDDVFD